MTARSATRRVARRRSASGARSTRSTGFRPRCKAGGRGPRAAGRVRAAPQSTCARWRPSARRVLIAVQLAATHWFYLYVVWFVPFALVALFAAHGAGPARAPRRPRAEREPVLRMRVDAATLGALALLAAGWALTLWVAPWSDERVNDLLVYRPSRSRCWTAALPYRDFAFEYPPLAAPADRAARRCRHRRGELPLGVRALDARRRGGAWCCSAARSRARPGGDAAPRDARGGADAAALRRARAHALRPRSRSRSCSAASCCSAATGRAPGWPCSAWAR